MTQAQRVLRYMEDNGSITAAEAMEHLGVMRLAARIFDLRAMGKVIDNQTVTKKNRYGDTVSYDRYVLRDSAGPAAGLVRTAASAMR